MKGFTNDRRVRVRIEPEYLDWWLLQVPCTLPLGSDRPKYLALEVDRHQLMMVLVPRDEETHASARP